MSIYNCHRQQPQPWMSYISPNKIVYPGECCPALVTDLSHLLPFQVISNGAYMKMEYSLYGEDSWTEITLPVTTVMTDGFFIHSYNGESLDLELPCGVYEFRLIAGETWYFEPIMIEDFDITTNEFSKVCGRENYIITLYDGEVVFYGTKSSGFIVTGKQIGRAHV